MTSVQSQVLDPGLVSIQFSGTLGVQAVVDAFDCYSSLGVSESTPTLWDIRQATIDLAPDRLVQIANAFGDPCIMDRRDSRTAFLVENESQEESMRSLRRLTRTRLRTEWRFFSTREEAIEWLCSEGAI